MSTKIENKIAEIFYEQLKGIFSIDAISALEAIKDMIDDRDNMIKELRDKLNSLTHNKPVEKLGSVHIKLPAGTYEIVNDKPAETEPVLCPSTHGTDYTIPTPDSSLDELYEVILQWDCLRKSDLVVPKEDIKDLAKAVREHIKSKIDEVGWCGVGDLDNISREDVLKALGID